MTNRGSAWNATIGEESVTFRQGMVELHDAVVDVDVFEAEARSPDSERVARALDLYTADLLPENYDLDMVARKRGLLRQTFSGAGLVIEVTRVTRGNVLGGVVRFGDAAPAATFTRDPRQLGPVHLDRTFESNRLALAPDQSGPRLAVRARRTLPVVRSRVE